MKCLRRTIKRHKKYKNRARSKYSRKVYKTHRRKSKRYLSRRQIGGSDFTTQVEINEFIDATIIKLNRFREFIQSGVTNEGNSSVLNLRLNTAKRIINELRCIKIVNDIIPPTESLDENSDLRGFALGYRTDIETMINRIKNRYNQEQPFTDLGYLDDCVSRINLRFYYLRTMNNLSLPGSEQTLYDKYVDKLTEEHLIGDGINIENGIYTIQ